MREITSPDATPLTPSFNPIPGLPIQIIQEIQTTPISTYSFITDEKGQIPASIEVDSQSDITILSDAPEIAALQVAGQASEFAAPAIPTIVATPMINQVSACLRDVDGKKTVVLTYNNSNSSDQALVPITSLNSELLRAPEDDSDDLLLNDLRHNNQTLVLPESELGTRDNLPASQVFLKGINSFAIPLPQDPGPLVWSLIGSQIAISESSLTCATPAPEPTPVSCSPFSNDDIDKILKTFQKHVSHTLKTASRFMRRGQSPYLKTTPVAYRQTLKILRSLRGSSFCPQGAILPSSCSPSDFPATQLSAAHAYIFRKPSPVKPDVFRRIGNTYKRRYSELLLSFPTLIYRCQ